MYSFYGGRPGNSFIIVTTFRSVQDMIDAFKQGPNYTAVHYDEYVMINAIDKNDPDNGKIFRRGYNFTEVKLNNQGQEIPTGGAQYIGTIAGPSGNAPDLYLTTIPDVQSKNAVAGSRRSGSYNAIDESNSLVPGKQGIGVSDQTIWHDEIKWESCFIKDQNSENTKAYIGFQIPYTVFDIDAETVSSQTPASVRQQVIENHPFYKHLTFSIPEGQKGDLINNLRVFEINDANKINIHGYDHKDQDASAKRKILVYDSYSYKTNDQGVKTTYYLGDYNMLKNIYLDEEGKIHVNYTHDYNGSDSSENQIINNSNPIKWINNISLDNKNNYVNINYNTGELDQIPFIWIDRVEFNDEQQQIEFYSSQNKTVPVCVCPIKTINKISSDESGNITVSYNDGEPSIIENAIKQVTNVTLDNGILNVYYSDNPNTPIPLNTSAIKWITGITTEDNQTYSINYNIGNPTQYTIKNISNVNLNDQGQLTITYNTGDPTILEQSLRWIKNVTIGSDNKIHIIWNNNNDVPIGNPINYILDAKVDNDNNFFIKYVVPPTDGTTDNQGYTYIKTLKTRAEYNVGDTQRDISWEGIGRISDNTTSNVRIVDFTLPVMGNFALDVKSIRQDHEASNLGFLYISDGENEDNITLLSESTQITKTFTGIHFTVTFINNTLKRSGIVNLSLSNMNLQFFNQ